MEAPQRASKTVGRAFRKARRAGHTIREAATVAGEDDDIPLEVVKFSLNSAESDACRRRRKNQEALEAAIELSKNEAKKKKVAANASRLVEVQAHAVRILSRQVDDNDDSEEDPYMVFCKRFKYDTAGGSGKGKGKAPM